MKKRLALAGSAALILGVLLVFVVPASRYRLLAYLGNEALYEGRPSGYWISTLQANDPVERRQAAMNLGDVVAVTDEPAGKKSLTALVDALGDADEFVRKCAATSLLMAPREATIPGELASVERLTAALRDKEIVVRRAAARGLWQTGAAAKQAEGVACLTAALADRDDFVRAYASRSLARIGPDAKAAVPTLLQHLRQDEDRDVRKLCAKTLGLIGAPAIGSDLPETVAALKQSLNEQPAGLRAYAATSLGQLGAKEAVPALKLAAKDRDERVRTSAAEALKALDSASP